MKCTQIYRTKSVKLNEKGTNTFITESSRNSTEAQTPHTHTHDYTSANFI